MHADCMAYVHVVSACVCVHSVLLHNTLTASVWIGCSVVNNKPDSNPVAGEANSEMLKYVNGTHTAA